MTHHVSGKFWLAGFKVKAAYMILLMSLAGVLLSGGAVAAENTVPAKEIDRKFFGMHIHHLDVPYPKGQRSGWPFIPFGSWRLWWTYTNWYELEPAKGKWDFSRLDRYVELAEEHGVDVMLTLGRTPQWASSRPQEPCGQGLGCAAEPSDLNDWADYVRTVASRYKGRISAYEIWNEPAFSEVEATFRDGRAAQSYSGSAAKMVELAKVAYTTLKEVDPAITVVSPSVTIEGNGLKRLEAFLKLGGGRWADAIGFHFYVAPPEVIVDVASRLRTLLNAYDLPNKPIWNTEMGYQFARADLGIQSQAPKGRWQDILDHEQGAGYVARALILSAGSGIQRVYWFNWDGEPPHPTMGLAGSAGHSPTTMSIAYNKVFNWLVGSRLTGCTRSSLEVWSCGIERGSRRGVLVWSEKMGGEWNPSPFRAVAFEQIGRADAAIDPGQKISIGPVPILVKAEPAAW